MKEFWNERYAAAEYAYGKNPNEFLAAEYSRIKSGDGVAKVLCIAEGEGRNASFLASKGFEVTAVDQSTEGLAKTKQLGKTLGVEITTIEADLEHFEIEPASWDGIVSISAHLPPDLRKKVHRQIVSGLKPGGTLILEAYTEKHLDMPGIGGPPVHQKEMFMALAELERELEGLDFVLAQETERHLHEGKYHQGLSAVVQVVAQRGGNKV